MLKSIRWQMLTYLLVGSIVFFSILILSANAELKELPEIIKAQYNEIANSRAGEVEKELAGFVDQVEVVSKTSLIKSMDLEKIKMYLPEFVLDSKVRNMTIAKPDGQGWNTRGVDVQISQQEQYEKIFIEKKEYHISQPFISPFAEPDTPIIIISHSVRSGEEITGLVNIVIEVNFLNTIIGQMSLGDTGYGLILNSEGLVVASNNAREYISDDKEAIQSVLGRESGTVEYNNADGSKRLAFFKKIKGSPDWTFIISISKDEVYRAVAKVRNTILALFFICFALILLFYYIYSGRVTRPIMKLKKVFEQAADGDLHVKADEGLPNEIGDAGKSFNLMLNRIKDLTYKDEVTGLYNYIGFLSELPCKVDLLRDKLGAIAVGIVSIDDFKKINGIIGYEGGNEALSTISRRLKAFINQDESLGRFFGDEFIFLIWEKDAETIEKRIESLWKNCCRIIRLKGYEFIIKVSIGVSLIPDKEREYSEVIHQATLAKLMAKKAGGNKYNLYSSSIDDVVREEQYIENELYHSIEKNELYMLYQPIIDVRTGEATGAEALLRWRHKEFGGMSIPNLIDIAEKSGFIVDLGNWVLKEACRQNKEWQSKGKKPITVSVNVSAFQFDQPNFVNMVRGVLNEIGLEPGYLQLEITETAAMDGVSEKLQKMKILKDMGVGIAIDDFGTGYSSMAYLTEFPIDTLKIDRSFVKNLSEDETAKAIANTIISMAKTMNMKSTAEGVETEEQLNFLKDRGCDQIQGYLISKPTEPLLFEKEFFK